MTTSRLSTGSSPRSSGIDRLALVAGFSMGAQQAYEWAVRYPAMVERLAPIAGTARTTDYNALVLRFAEEAILEAPTPEEGLRRHAHVWAATGLSTELFRTEAWRAQASRRSTIWFDACSRTTSRPCTRATWSACAASGARSTSRDTPDGDLGAALGADHGADLRDSVLERQPLPAHRLRSRPGAHRRAATSACSRARGATGRGR